MCVCMHVCVCFARNIEHGATDVSGLPASLTHFGFPCFSTLCQNFARSSPELMGLR